MEKNGCLEIPNKEKYKTFCEQETSISIFCQTYWMDAVCGAENWDVILVENSGGIIGALVYYYVRSGTKIFVYQPPFTQSNGIWIKYPQNQNYEKRLSHEKKIMTELIDGIEKLPLVSYKQCQSIQLTNWLPFYWKGYQQTTYYSYRIMDISDMELVEKNFSPSAKGHIRHALKSEIKIECDLSAEEFYEYHKTFLELRGEQISYSFDLFQRIYSCAYEHKVGRVFYAIDSEKVVQGAIFVIWDDDCAYDLIHTINPRCRDRGALMLLILESIRKLSGRVKSFDMEGSMIEQVEQSYRQFGTKQLPYFLITKTFVSTPSLWIYKGIRKLKSMVKGN